MLPMFMQKPFDVQYFQHIKRLFGSALIGYWPLDEAAGASTVTDYSGQGNNGTPTAVTFGQAGIGDGRTAASFNGTTSNCDVYSAGLVADFNGQEGTFAIWIKLTSTVLTDGTSDYAIILQVDANNFIWIRKQTTNNQLAWAYSAGGTSKSGSSSFSLTSFAHLALVWSLSGDYVKFYLNGSQSGATQTGLGTWVGNLAATTTVIGASNNTSVSEWNGLLAHAILTNTAATPQEIAEAARVV